MLASYMYLLSQGAFCKFTTDMQVKPFAFGWIAAYQTYVCNDYCAGKSPPFLDLPETTATRINSRKIRDI